MFAPARPAPSRALERAILALLVLGHASRRAIQALLGELGWGRVSLGSIAAVLTTAQQRALAWFAAHRPVHLRVVALDELYGRARRRAYLTVIDPQTGVVWATAASVPVDTDTWSLLLWQAHEQGVFWEYPISDGGSAMAAACSLIAPDAPQARDCWHVLHSWGQVQARLERRQADLQQQVDAGAAARAAGRRRGRVPGAAAGQRLPGVARTVSNFAYLGQQLRELLGVVVRVGGRVLDSAARRTHLAALLDLAEEVGQAAGAAEAGAIAAVVAQTRAALRGLLVFTAAVDAAQATAATRLGEAAVDLLGWAWQRRQGLGWEGGDILAGVPAGWRVAAAELLAAWASAVRASSWVEAWHSLVRPHLAVHRRLAPGLLALLAVWHNHRVYERGAHVGQSPLQQAGGAEVSQDWLTALGYPPAEEERGPAPCTAGHLLAFPAPRQLAA